MPLTPELPARAALLLDLDGTLLDIAPTPDAVVVPPALPDHLRAIRRKLDDAVAVVTGRPIAQIDALLGDAPFAVAGEHGAAIRHAPRSEIVRGELPSVPASWLDLAAQEVARHEGSLLEHKAHGFVFHFRLAPESGPALREAAERIVGEASDRFTILSAHMAWEVKPRGADKGIAVGKLLADRPFQGRVPVYIGDDVTDEDGMRVARDAGGLGWQVQDVFGTPAGVRAWLAAIAA